MGITCTHRDNRQVTYSKLNPEKPRNHRKAEQPCSNTLQVEYRTTLGDKDNTPLGTNFRVDLLHSMGGGGRGRTRRKWCWEDLVPRSVSIDTVSRKAFTLSPLPKTGSESSPEGVRCLITRVTRYLKSKEAWAGQN